MESFANNMSPDLAEKIKKGAIGVLPTDTVYGLCCSALNKKAVERVYHLKGKPAGLPLIVLISSPEELKRFGVSTGTKDSAILRKLWPNPVSVILPVPDKKFFYLHRGSETVSFRLPKEKWLRDFVAKSGPIIATSANVFNQPNSATIEQAIAYFGEQADFYADAGELRGEPSTIIILEAGEVHLMRDGKYKIPPSIKFHRAIQKKTWPELFEAIRSGKKKFDLRLADFSVAEGDLLLLQEYDPRIKDYTGRSLRKKVSYILKFKVDKYPFASREEVEKHGFQILSLD